MLRRSNEPMFKYVKFRYSEKAIEMWPILTGKNGSDLLGFNESTSQNSYLQVVII